mmetsp:Transcript_43642/g.115320  ORF Transcript_43642/g.115320 Transcript_43642/m.115320 type:complete len:700 (-) Transcript_43642:273-2372(-)
MSDTCIWRRPDTPRTPQKTRYSFDGSSTRSTAPSTGQVERIARQVHLKRSTEGLAVREVLELRAHLEHASEDHERRTAAACLVLGALSLANVAGVSVGVCPEVASTASPVPQALQALTTPAAFVNLLRSFQSEVDMCRVSRSELDRARTTLQGWRGTRPLSVRDGAGGHPIVHRMAQWLQAAVDYADIRTGTCSGSRRSESSAATCRAPQAEKDALRARCRSMTIEIAATATDGATPRLQPRRLVLQRGQRVSLLPSPCGSQRRESWASSTAEVLARAVPARPSTSRQSALQQRSQQRESWASSTAELLARAAPVKPNTPRPGTMQQPRARLLSDPVVPVRLRVAAFPGQDDNRRLSCGYVHPGQHTPPSSSRSPVNAVESQLPRFEHQTSPRSRIPRLPFPQTNQELVAPNFQETSDGESGPSEVAKCQQDETTREGSSDTECGSARGSVSLLSLDSSDESSEEEASVRVEVEHDRRAALKDLRKALDQAHVVRHSSVSAVQNTGTYRDRGAVTKCQWFADERETHSVPRNRSDQLQPHQSPERFSLFSDDRSCSPHARQCRQSPERFVICDDSDTERETPGTLLREIGDSLPDSSGKSSILPGSPSHCSAPTEDLGGDSPPGMLKRMAVTSEQLAARTLEPERAGVAVSFDEHEEVQRELTFLSELQGQVVALLDELREMQQPRQSSSSSRDLYSRP